MARPRRWCPPSASINQLQMQHLLSRGLVDLVVAPLDRTPTAVAPPKLDGAGHPCSEFGPAGVKKMEQGR